MRRHLLLLPVALGLALSSACGEFSGFRLTRGPGCAPDARQAPMGFTLKDTNGASVRLADYKGKVVLINFWATWCVPCRTEIPVLVELQEKYRVQGLEVLGVVVLDDFANAGPFADKHGINYTIVDATSRTDVEEAFGPLRGTPTSILIARDGAMCFEHVGIPRPQGGEDAEEAIRRTFDAEIKALL
jgi:thiol-disulfide isomerase/thioredoxin